MKIVQNILFTIFYATNIFCIIQNDENSKQFNIFKSKTIFANKQNQDNNFKIDGYSIPQVISNRNLNNVKLNDQQDNIQKDIQQPTKKLQLFGKKTFLHTDVKKQPRKTQDMHDQIKQAIEDSNHQYPVIVLNKVSKEEKEQQEQQQIKQETEDIREGIVSQEQSENQLQDSSSTSLEQSNQHIQVQDSITSQDQQITNNDTPKENTTSGQSILDTYHYDKDYLYQDPYYVKHPLYYNPYDKFGFEKNKKEPEENITIDEIDTLVEVLNFISSIYYQIFSALPEENSKKEKGNLERTMDVLRFYVKVKMFLKTVIQQRDQLIEDMNFLEGKVHLLKFKNENVVNFYNLESQYFKVQLKQMTYRNDLRMQSYVKDFDSIVQKFGEDAKNVLQFAYNLGNFTQLFLEEVEELQKTDTNQPAFQVLVTFDKVMMLIIKLLENKMSIERAIHNFRNSMLNLKKYKLGIEETFYNMLNFDNKLEIKLEEKPKLGKGALRNTIKVIFSIFSMFILIQFQYINLPI